MLEKCFTNARGIFLLCLYFINTVCWAVPIFVAAILKFLLPFKPLRKFFDIVLNGCASNWVWVNSMNQNIFCNIRWHVSGTEHLKPVGWYLVVANHQSWTDILVLQKIFHGKIPFLKFFLKEQLFWIPILGQAWWALDFPFMKRYSREFLKKNPHLKGRDMETTKKACEKFKTVPVSVMNFAEGTRFTSGKHRRQRSPFKHLLCPRAGGLAFTLGAMGEHLHSFIDVTIAYPSGVKNFWDYLCGRVQDIRVQVRTLPITQEMLGDYFHDEIFREAFQNWVNALWEQKDACISKMLASPEPHIAAEPLHLPPFRIPFPETILFPENAPSLLVQDGKR
ncbi:MAG: acyltransferase [Desulfobacterales bacterium]